MSRRNGQFETACAPKVVRRPTRENIFQRFWLWQSEGGSGKVINWLSDKVSDWLVEWEKKSRTKKFFFVKKFWDWKKIDYKLSLITRNYKLSLITNGFKKFKKWKKFFLNFWKNKTKKISFFFSISKFSIYHIPLNFTLKKLIKAKKFERKKKKIPKKIPKKNANSHAIASCFTCDTSAGNSNLKII